MTYITNSQRRAAVEHAQGAHDSTWGVYCLVCRGESKPLPTVAEAIFTALSVLSDAQEQMKFFPEFANDAINSAKLGLDEALSITGQRRDAAGDADVTSIANDWYDRWIGSRHRAARLRADAALDRMA